MPSTNPTPPPKLIFMPHLPHLNSYLCHIPTPTFAANQQTWVCRRIGSLRLLKTQKYHQLTLKKNGGRGGIVKTPKTTNCPGGRWGGMNLSLDGGGGRQLPPLAFQCLHPCPLATGPAVVRG